MSQVKRRKAKQTNTQIKKQVHKPKQTSRGNPVRHSGENVRNEVRVRKRNG